MIIIGQRLVMVVKDDEENDIAGIWFHWSAFTISALYETERFLNDFFSDHYKKYDDIKLRILRICESYGGGISETEEERIKEMWPHRKIKIDDRNRNNGLVAFSEEEIENWMRYAEGIIQIYLKNQNTDAEILNDVMYYDFLENFSEYEAELDDEDAPHEGIPELLIDPSEFPFCELRNVITALEALPSIWCKNGDMVYQLIQ